MYASSFVFTERTIIGPGYFLTSTTLDYCSAHVVEICGCLVALQSIDDLFSDDDDSAQIDLHMSIDYLVFIKKLKKESKCISMSTKLHPKVREFINLNIKRLSSLKFIEVDSHQDDIKSFDQSTFLE